MADTADTAAATAAAAAAATPTLAGPLAFMDKLSSSVYLYRPATLPTAGPPVILICAWMGAKPAHIYKYIAPYRDGSVFGPGSADPAIVLVFCEKATAASSKAAAAVAAVAAPAVRAVLGDALDPDSSPNSDPSGRPPLVHVFSNGGALVLSQLYAAIAESGSDATKNGKSGTACLPPHVTVFDSCPGHFHYWCAVAAFSMGFQHLPLLRRLVFLPVTHAMSAVMYARINGYILWLWLASFVRTPKADDRVRPDMDPWRPHNDTSPYGGNRRELRRAYLFSDGDAIILAADTQAHAAEARSKGFTVAHEANFGASAHVAHLRADPVRYWQTVRDTYLG